MNKKYVVSLDADNKFTGMTEAWESPLEEGVYHIPANAYEDIPEPTVPENHFATWSGTEWTYEEIIIPEEPSEEEVQAQLFEEMSADWTYAEWRAYEYPPAADYLDAIVKGDEAQKQAYIDACLAVKAKYPKPE